MNRPEISVVIPTLGRKDDLKDCLDALSRQVFTNLEVVIVSNGKEGLAYLAGEYKALNVSVFQENIKGLIFARNTGLFNARGRIVSFIDDDVVVSDHWAQEVCNTFNSSPEIGGVSGPTLIPLDRLDNRDILIFHNKIKKNTLWKIIGKFYTHFVLEGKPDSIGKIFKSGAFSLGPNYEESRNLPGNIEVDYLEACNMSFRKDILDKTGGFLPVYKGVGDWSEPDLAFRVRKEGYRLLFNPKAVIWHNVSQKGVFLDRGADSYQRAKNFIYFYFKWIKPNSVSKALGFAANLFFLNMYWCYKFLKTKSPYWLGGLRGTFDGLSEGLRRP